MANKKRLIDVEQAKRATYEEIFWTESEQAAVRNFLAKLPKVDAVEVVRCKNCKHYCQYPTVDKPKACFVHPLTPHFMPEDGFCSYGERKDNENQN